VNDEGYGWWQVIAQEMYFAYSVGLQGIKMETHNKQAT
jgi:hypothetical protein